MDPTFFLKTLHVMAAFGIFAGIGMILVPDSPSARKTGSMIHGIGLLVSILLGFAMLKKPPMEQHWWMVKGVMWLVLGAIPVLAKRKVLPTAAILTLALLAGGTAAYMAMAKPF